MPCVRASEAHSPGCRIPCTSREASPGLVDARRDRRLKLARRSATGETAPQARRKTVRENPARPQSAWSACRHASLSPADARGSRLRPRGTFRPAGEFRCSGRLERASSGHNQLMLVRPQRRTDAPPRRPPVPLRTRLVRAFDRRRFPVAPEPDRGGPPPTSQDCACSSSADGTTIGPSGGWVKRIGFPKGSRSAQSVP